MLLMPLKLFFFRCVYFFVDGFTDHFEPDPDIEEPFDQIK